MIINVINLDTINQKMIKFQKIKEWKYFHKHSIPKIPIYI